MRNGVNRGGFRRMQLYGEMYVQICRDYNVLPPFHEITSAEIEWFYSYLRPELLKHTAE